MADDPDIRVRRAPPLARLSLRLTEPAIALAGLALDLDLSLPMNRATTTGGRSALRLGPDEWLILSAAADPLEQAFSASAIAPYSAVNISQRQIALTLETRHAADMLNALCPLDLNVAAFPPMTATRTLFGKSEIVLWRIEPALFHLEVARSFAPYVAGLLAEIGREYID